MVKRFIANLKGHNTNASVVRDLQKLESRLRDVYNSAEIKKPTENGGVKYMLGVTQEDINRYVQNAKAQKNTKSYKKYAQVSERLLNDVKDEIDLSGYTHALRDNDIRHILNSHGERTNEKYPVTEADIENIPYIVENYDKIYYRLSNKGMPSLLFVKTTEDNNIYFVEQSVSNYNGEKLLINKQMIKTGINDIPNTYLDTITKKQSKNDFLADLNEVRKEHAQSVNQIYPNDSIRQTSEKSQEIFSERDSNGNSLSKGQQEYFKNSVVRDEGGKLLLVYHGTRKADFTIFKRNLNYYTDSEAVADSYAPNSEKFTGYLKIEKPFVIDAHGDKWSGIIIDDDLKEKLQEYGSSVFKENGKWKTSVADIASAILAQTLVALLHI